MSKDEKLIKRFLARPKDFTYDELRKMLNSFGYEEDQQGKTSGSRIEFLNKDKGLSYGAHKPHPDSPIKSYVMKQVLEFLTYNNLI